jgi:hypothetical protein
MLDRSTRDFHQAFYPNDLDSLKSVFVALCSKHRILPESSEASDIAAHLVGLFQGGMTDETALKSAARAWYQSSMGRSARAR